MSGLPPQEDYWGQQSGYTNSYNFNVDNTSGFGPGHQELDFQDTSQYENVSSAIYDPTAYTPVDPTGHFETGPSGNEYDDEPPLLEELGIDPDRIMEKTLAVLNPFHKTGLVDDASFLTKDTDLAGPLVFCLMLGATLLVSGGKANFGYIYGLAVTGCLLMYAILSLMNTAGAVSITAVASILGYCLLPVVVLSVLSIFLSLKGLLGTVLSVLIVGWCSLSASRLFATLMASDCSQRPLIAYPCCLLYGVFILIVIF